MKTQLAILIVSTIAIQAMAQETNSSVLHTNTNYSVQKKANRGKKRRLHLMERALKRIGITEEEQKQIITLQNRHKEKMKANMQRIGETRKELSRLQDEGASEETLETAIQNVADAQAEQLKILVKNRMEMERILGKEKYARFMENARTAFRKHGRRGGPIMPPRPGLPPVPGRKNAPPPPKADEPPPVPPI